MDGGFWLLGLHCGRPHLHQDGPRWSRRREELGRPTVLFLGRRLCWCCRSDFTVLSGWVVGPVRPRLSYCCGGERLGTHKRWKENFGISVSVEASKSHTSGSLWEWRSPNDNDKVFIHILLWHVRHENVSEVLPTSTSLQSSWWGLFPCGLELVL